MPVVFGEMLASVDAMLDAFRRHGDQMRCIYRAHYRFDMNTSDQYKGVRLERPDSLAGNPPDVVYPWEQIFISAAACAGSDYPMLAAHFGIPLDRIDFTVEGVFDPRGEFDGLAGYAAPLDARHCYRSIDLYTTVVSSAPREQLEMLHRRAISYNMVLGGLRGIPQTSHLTIERSDGALVGATQ
jgi:uncharacterized OsmC-like protein